jgi:hypothetical protein
MATFYLNVNDARHRMKLAWSSACELLRHGKPVRVVVQEMKSLRSIEQNDKFHALCQDIAKAKTWAGKERDVEAWKRLLVDCWARHENRKQCEVVPSLDGQSVVNLGIQTRNMKVSDMSELIEFSQWWAIENGVNLNHE